MMKVTVRPRQTLPDIAVQVYGTISAVPLIAGTNRIPMSGPLEPGTELECPDNVYDRYMQDYVRNNGISPASAAGGGDGIKVSVFTGHFTEEFA